MNGSSAGLWMLLLLAALVLRSGLPVWALLIGTASLLAALGCAMGRMDLHVLAALSGRILGLLDNDLLQALPLYVLVGVLLNHLRVAEALFSVMARLLRATGAAASLASLGIGLLLAPMNGSVASSSALVARVLGARLSSMKAADAVALLSVSATIGVVVPPSLVLILLGDAMLRAHTEASNLAGYALGTQRLINTQDVFHAALGPAGAVLLLWALVAWWRGRHTPTAERVTTVAAGHWGLALAAAGAIGVLLGGVFLGKILAVEASATACVLLMLLTLLSRSLDAAQWRTVFTEAMQLSGALLALLVGASTFSLVFNLLGTPQWITQAIAQSGLAPRTTAALVLLGVALCASVMDAFEMIFVIIPLLAPPLIVSLGDAEQVAVLLLLVLQTGYLIPPMGYAVLLARRRTGTEKVGSAALLRALLPYGLVQCLVIASVFAVPALVHFLDAADTTPLSHATQADVEQQMRDMSEPSRESAP